MGQCVPLWCVFGVGLNRKFREPQPYELTEIASADDFSQVLPLPCFGLPCFKLGLGLSRL